MRRNVIFRGKVIDEPNRWVEGYLVVADGMAVIFTQIGNFHVEPDTVGQFTGLMDKNGKRIFEGDIIRHYDDNPYAGIEEKGVVFWDEEFLCFRRTSNGGFHHGKVDTYRLSAKCDYEVIGNIHDNPELLREAQNENR